MRMSPTQEAAMRMALEALHEIGWSNNTRWQSDRAATVIPALRGALAEPVQEPVQEPVAWRISVPNEPDLGHWFAEDSCGDGYLNEPLFTAPPQRKPLVDPAEYDDAGAAERYNRGLK